MVPAPVQNSLTTYLAEGVHGKIVQEQLGHANIAMTLDLYSHVTADMQQHAADAWEATITEGSDEAREAPRTLTSLASAIDAWPPRGGQASAIAQLRQDDYRRWVRVKVLRGGKRWPRPSRCAAPVASETARWTEEK